MSGSFIENTPESAERQYEMDSYEIRAVPFAHDPVNYLKDLYATIQNSGHDEQNALFKVIDEFTALIMVVLDGGVQTENENLVTYMNPDNAYEQKKAFIELMQQVGVRRKDLVVWSEIIDIDSSSSERLEERSYGLAIAEVYGKDQ